jgi:beta-galactosidase
MKLTFTIFLSFIIIIGFSQQNDERFLSLNGEWKFKTDPYGKGESLSWYNEDVNDNAWDSMAVPGNWDLRNEYSHYAGKAWYRTRFTAPSSWQTKSVRLFFEGVYHDSRVWLNGHLLGSNNSGFLPFEFEVSKWLNYNAPNTIAVCADNSFRRGAIWNWGGIRRPVTLKVTNAVRIVRHVISPVVDLKNLTAQVAVRLQIKNDETTPVSLVGVVELSDEKGFRKSLPFTVNVDAGKTAETIVRTTLSGKQVHLWNCDEPHLYRSKASIRNSSAPLDENNERFGLRKIEVDNNRYIFKLNGEPMRVMGFNLVPDDRTTGNTLPLWRIKEDIDLMKTMGANLARLTHLPIPEEMLDYLDEKGIMIFSEIPLWGYDQLVDKNNSIPKEWLKRMITSQYNHPSIIGWSVGNEIGHVSAAMEYVQSAIEYAKTLDSTRLAVMVSHTADRGVSDPINYSEMGLINKYGSAIGMLADKIHGLHPDKLLFYSEYGYGQLAEDLDADVNAKAMVDSLRYKPYLMGGSLWTFNDYRSAYPGTKEHSENRPWGVVDVFRQKKKAWFSFKKEYQPVRELAVNNFVRNKDASATITIKPRLALDLPAYPLQNYTLVWNICDENGIVQKGSFMNLPNIKPGDAAIEFPINWQMPADAFKLHVSLLSPLNYCVADTIIFLQKPASPEIIYAGSGRMQMNDLRENSGTLRVAFKKTETADYYKLRYGKNDLANETQATRNNYVVVSNLAFGDTYQVAITAVNSFGESEPANKTNVEIETDYPPPFITYTEAADKGFYVGYPTDQEDYLFQLQYTTIKGNYSTAPILQTDNKGVLFVPGLMNGKQYYFRMRRIKDNNYLTGWSEEHGIIPDGQQMPAKPNLQGVIRNNNEAILIFEPVKKAVGYTVNYRTQNAAEWKTIEINAADIKHFKITGLNRKQVYEFRMASKNVYGTSGFTETVKQ